MTDRFLAVAGTPANNLTFTNKVFVTHDKFQELRHGLSDTIPLGKDETLVIVQKWVFTASPHEKIEPGTIGLNLLQRRGANVALNAPVDVRPFTASRAALTMVALELSVDLLVKGKGRSKPVDAAKLSDSFKVAFAHQVFTPGQSLAMTFSGSKLQITVESLENATISSDGAGPGKLSTNPSVHGLLTGATAVSWTRPAGGLVHLEGAGAAGGQNAMFRTDFDFVKLGIGGLGQEFSQIFRRAFASRIFETTVVRELGIPHVRGMLLYGPPGCGKTLIARQLGKALNAREPKIVNGPEVLDKYVGGSEEKIRNLFADAEKEQAQEGDASMLHIIIFDEIDAICKTRGTVRDGTGVSDSVVNQLLSKIDGVDTLNNVLIIGMTNRKDMIDDALLRPGRLEVHVEIPLPDEAGRLEILKIRTLAMREHGRLAAEVIDKMEDLARSTKNYSGAEIEGLVKSAASYAFGRQIDFKNLDKPADAKELVVRWEDFERALEEVQPKFGADNQELNALYMNGIVSTGEEFEKARDTLDRLVEQIRVSENTRIMSVLLEGEAFSGKTALMAYTAVNSDFPFIRKISADDMIGMGEASKASYISGVFQDSYKSPLSVILIDDLERVIDFVKIGPRFSNTVLQTLLVLLKKPPSQKNRLLVMATTAVPYLLEDLMLVQAFMVSVHVPQLQGADSIQRVLRTLAPMSPEDMDRIAAVLTRPIGIKKLLTVTDMARPDGINVSVELFIECLYASGYHIDAYSSAPQS